MIVHSFDLFISSWNFRLTLLAFWRRPWLGSFVLSFVPYLVFWSSRIWLSTLTTRGGVYASFCGCLRSGDFWGLLSVLLGLTEHWRLATGRRVSRSYFLSCLPSVRVVVLTSRSSIRPILITLSPFHFPPAIGFGLRNEQGTLMASGIPSVAF